MGNYGCDLVSAILDFRRLMECDLSIGMLFPFGSKGVRCETRSFFLFLKLKKILFLQKILLTKFYKCVYILLNNDFYV